MKEATCDWFLASHGCDLALGHEGDHVCDPEGTESEEGDPCGFTWPRGHEHEFQLTR